MKYPSAMARFMAKVSKTDDGCWLWTARKLPSGYGQFWFHGEKVYAHRWAYTYLGGMPLVPKMVIDHLCRNPSCVNPSHLEQVTNHENCVIRGTGANYETYRTDICKRGHSMADAIVRPHGRRCRKCHNEEQRLYRRKKGIPVRGSNEDLLNRQKPNGGVPEVIQS
jgi:hypothetical protein